ncbi:MAG: hypothetical protein B7Z55_11950, partial [Planctomycetales bacterium 12-60-4]
KPRPPSLADITDVLASPPPRFPANSVFDDSKARVSPRQRIGGAPVTSRPEDRPSAAGIDSVRNYPQALPDQHQGCGLYLLVAPFARREMRGGYPRNTVVLVNGTSDLLEFVAVQDNLPLVQEALDAEGQWRPIEYFPDVAESAAQTTAYLPPRHYWSMTTRSYRGSFQTRCRLTLELIGGRRLISNEYEQSIEPAQFDSGWFVREPDIDD